MRQIPASDPYPTRITHPGEDLSMLQRHLKEVIDGDAFKGSNRSRRFLTYIVEQAVAGEFDSLKERIIGINLFGRVPSYDTGDDAIVRVTASDVRKRLLQHYGTYGATSGFRISLPLGTYVPTFSREPMGNGNGDHHSPASMELRAKREDPTAHPGTAHPVTDVGDPDSAGPLVSQPETSTIRRSSSRAWWPVVLVTTVLNLAVCGFVWRHVHASGPPLSLPYSAFFQSPDPIQIITSDPDIALIQQYAGGNISLSDYANHRLAADTDSFPADVRRFADLILHDEKTSLATTRIVMGIAELAQAHSKHVTMTTARSIRMSDLRSNDDFILIGSPRSNPWSAVFADELDFRFSFDKALGQEIIRNVHPRPHEALQYIPTAMGGATGQSYAIIALVRNPDQYGQVLLLAGANGESTEAAANFAMDTTRISAALQTCGVSPASRLQHFELLLRVDTMAGSPSNTNVEACHVLSGAPMPS